jgi:hypothetical protein
MLEELWEKVSCVNNFLSLQGYSPLDILNTMFKVTKNSDLPEFIQLEFMKVSVVLFFILRV